MRCNDARLQQLLSADETSHEYQEAATHVESCADCQQRLTELSGDNKLLNEVRDTLGGCEDPEPYRASLNSSVVISIEGSLSDEIGAECEPVSLNFLAPPSHPEMLGRIGRYEVERMIGSGGMGIVLKGFDTELHRVVAIKVLKPHLAHNGAARQRFSREAQSAAAVVHEHVIPIHDVQSDGETPFLVMQYVPGQSLQARVDERGPLEPKEILRIAKQAAAGLAAAHAQGLVHRDVKPANILLEESVDRVLISDFGLARTVDDATLTKTGIVAGTPHYMSPEQASGQPVDHRSDLFSLGSVIYFMCAGRPPFRGEQPLAILNRICNDQHRPVDEVNHDVPAELAEIVDQLLAKEPNDRIRTAFELTHRLESILARIQKGRRAYPLKWRRVWLRNRSNVWKSVRKLSVFAACVFAGMALASWYWSVPAKPQADATVGDEAPENIEESQQIATAPRKTTSSRKSTPPKSSRTPRAEVPVDEFMNELDQIEAAVSEIESQWKLRPAPAVRQVPSQNPWQQDLEQVQGIIDGLEKSTAR